MLQIVTVTTKCNRNLLQSSAGIAKCDRKLLQNMTGITKCDKQLLQRTASITKFDNYYKVTVSHKGQSYRTTEFCTEPVDNWESVTYRESAFHRQKFIKLINLNILIDRQTTLSFVVKWHEDSHMADDFLWNKSVSACKEN